MNKSLTKSIMKQAGIASLAASMFALVGCDGDTNTNVNASGEAADLKVAAPTVTQLPLSTLHAVVDDVVTGSTAVWSDGADIEIGDRFRFNFLSASQIEIEEKWNRLGGNSAQTDFQYLPGATETEFSVAYNIFPLNGTPGTITIKFDVLDSEGYTLIGSFVTGSQILVRSFSLNAFGADNIAIVNDDADARAAGLGRAGSDRPSIRAGTGVTANTANIPDGALLVVLQDSSAWIIDASEVDVDSTADSFDVGASTPSLASAVANYDPNTDRILLDGTGSNLDLSSALQAAYDAGTTTAWRKVEIQRGILEDSVTGTFRLDMNPSQGGVALIDSEGLNRF